MADKDEKDDVRVNDRRIFDRDGNPVSDSRADAGVSGEPAEEEDYSDLSGTGERIDFITILFSYVHTAMIHLGDVEDPLTKITQENLDAARQMIEILELLQDKTRGNLNKREEQYLESALFDLRMRVMKKAKLIK